MCNRALAQQKIYITLLFVNIMRYPSIKFSGIYHLDLEIPENYNELVKNIDEDFIRGTKNLVQLILKEFEAKGPLFNLQFDEKRGLHGIHIGNGRGAYLYENKWVFKNIDESWQAFAVFNIISLYLNKLQEYKK